MTDSNAPEITMDADALYREEIYTDQKVGTIRKMTPVDASGNEDSSRPTLYVGQAQMMTPAGALPLTFEIPADDLVGAIAGFGDGANQALEETMRELQEMRRQQASQIVVPGESSSKIQIP